MRLLNVLSAQGKGVSRLQKPDEIFLENTTLSYAVRNISDKGSLWETFLLGQLLNAGFDVFKSQSGDFLVNDITTEVAGKNKTPKQVRNASSYSIAADNVESDLNAKIPLCLLGFLY